MDRREFDRESIAVYLDRDPSLRGLRAWIANRRTVWLPAIRETCDLMVDEAGRWQGRWPLSAFAWQQVSGRLDLTIFSQVKRLTCWLGSARGDPAVHEPMRQWLRSLFLIHFHKFRGVFPLLDEESGTIVAFSRRRSDWSMVEVFDAWQQAIEDAGLLPHYGIGYERCVMMYCRQRDLCWRFPDGRSSYLGMCFQWDECQRESPSVDWLLLADSPDLMGWRPGGGRWWSRKRLPLEPSLIRTQLVEFAAEGPDRESMGRRISGLQVQPFSGICAERVCRGIRCNPAWLSSMRLIAEQYQGQDRYAAGCGIWGYLRPLSHSPTMWIAAEELVFQALFGAKGDES